MKRELVITLLTLSLLASSLPTSALASGTAESAPQQVEIHREDQEGTENSHYEEAAEEAAEEEGAFVFNEERYASMSEAFAAASSGGVVTLAGAYGGGEGEEIVQIPAQVVLSVAKGGALTVEAEDAAELLQSAGTIQVEAGGRLEFLGQTYIGDSAGSVLRLTAGTVELDQFRLADGKFRMTLQAGAQAEIPEGEELKLTLPLEKDSGLDLTVESGASLTVNGALAATGSQSVGGTDQPSALRIAGALTVGGSGQLRMSYGSSMTVAETGRLTLNQTGVLDNNPDGPGAYENAVKRFTFDQGATVVAPAGCQWDLTRFTESPVTSYVDPATGETVYGNNGSAVVPEEGFAAAIGGTQYATLAEAVRSAKPGDVIQLLRDEEVDATGLVNNQSALTVNKDLTLEGNGFAIIAKEGTFTFDSAESGGPSLMNVESGADVTLRNVVLQGAQAAKHGLNIYGAGTVTLENVEIQGCRWYAAVVNDAQLQVKGLTTSGNRWGINLDKTSSAVLADAVLGEEDSVVFEGESPDSSLTIESGSFQNIKTQGDDTQGSVTISGGTVESVSNESPAEIGISGGTVGSIANSSTGAVSISGGTILGSVSSTGGGSIEVTGGSFVSADVGEFVDPDQTVILTLDANGGTCDLKTLVAASGAPVGTLPEAARDGYTLKGWYTAANGGEKVTGETAFTDNTTLYAQWAEKDNSNGDNGSTSGEFLVAVDRVTGGTVRVNPGRADRGETVTVTVTPKTGYRLEKLTITDARGRTVETKKDGENRYTFEMPASQVQVAAKFTRTSGESSLPFRDVAAGAYYYDAVKWAYEEDIANGVTGSLFAPGRACTRAQIVTFLWRASGSPQAEERNMPFTDVDRDSYYYEAVLWALEEGITAGVTDTRFAPDQTCTRGQAAVLLWRAQGAPEQEGSSSFQDVRQDAYYAEAIRWAAESGVTNGITADRFAPDEHCTRGQIVTFLYRAMVE